MFLSPMLKPLTSFFLFSLLADDHVDADCCKILELLLSFPSSAGWSERAILVAIKVLFSLALNS